MQQGTSVYTVYTKKQHFIIYDAKWQSANKDMIKPNRYKII